jgi:two-component system alkaline phosphatase synthesis response regulator PhoP
MARLILVVDDETHIVQVLSIKLRNAGYEVMTAADGKEALEFASRRIPDLVITDFKMPTMTGIELCRALAERDDTAHVPVLILTAHAADLLDDDLAIGNIRDVLSKPFSPRSVLRQVEGVFTGSPDDSSEAA